jgi:predicted transcriptional regulator
MKMEVEITPELHHRVASIATRLGKTSTEVITDALENGHSITWQEQFFEAVSKGVAAANRGEFAAPTDVERVRNKYRPA